MSISIDTNVKYTEWSQSAKNFNDCYQIFDLFGLDDQKFNKAYDDINHFMDVIMDRSTLTAFDSVTQKSEEQEFWRELPNFFLPTLVQNGLLEHLDQAYLFGEQGVEALKYYAALGLWSQKSNLDKKCNFENLENSTVYRLVTARRKDALVSNDKTHVSNSNALHHYIFFKTICSVEQWNIFKSNQEGIKLKIDERILDGFNAGENINWLAREFNCSSKNISDYIQTREALLDQAFFEVTMDNLNVAPFAIEASQKITKVSSASNAQDVRSEMAWRAAGMASEVFSLEVNHGHILNRTGDSTTESTKAEISFLLAQNVSKKLISMKAASPSQIKVADRFGAVIEAQEAAQRPIRNLPGDRGRRVGPGSGSGRG